MTNKKSEGFKVDSYIEVYYMNLSGRNLSEERLSPKPPSKDFNIKITIPRTAGDSYFKY